MWFNQFCEVEGAVAARLSLPQGIIVGVLLYFRGASAVGTAFGYGSGTTGGGSAAAAVPTSTSQLVSCPADIYNKAGRQHRSLTSLCPRFELIQGSTTGTACAPWTCTPNPQLAIDANSWCESQYPSAAKSTVTYKTAGVSAITVNSNKTLLGKGSAGGIKGKGLRIVGGKNIIIQNIRISDINARFVWGGDAITIDGGTNIWIKNIGRQMIVTGYGAAQSVTISNNVFEGSGATCNGRHYWTLYFTGASDTITFARNYVYMTSDSGRGPKVGGTSGYSRKCHIIQSLCPCDNAVLVFAELIHMYNNYYVSVAGHALDAGVGSHVIMEGNYFNAVRIMSLHPPSAALQDMPLLQSIPRMLLNVVHTLDVIAIPIHCESRPPPPSGVELSGILSSGTLDRNDLGTLPYFSSAFSSHGIISQSVVKSASIMAASSVGELICLGCTVSAGICELRRVVGTCLHFKRWASAWWIRIITLEKHMNVRPDFDPSALSTTCFLSYRSLMTFVLTRAAVLPRLTANSRRTFSSARPLSKEFKNILVSRPHPNVTLLTLNRPRALNALSTPLFEEFNEVLDVIEKDEEVGALVITGSEKAFAAGADIKEMKAKQFTDVYKNNFLGDWTKITTFRKPTIAAVSGFALGGGCELAMMCDIILASPTAQFGQPEIKLGVIPGAGGTQRLTHAIGKSRAMELVLTGRIIDAQEAEKWGLVSRVVEGDVVKEAIEMASTIAGMGRVAVQAGKESVNAAYELSLRDGLHFERRLFQSLFATHDQKEGMSAFTEKREPKWSHS
ncbi:hypothetical protein FRC10_011291 [Ceratobasidium sp. 414]|nr:hypothetical protein FRC10_011291 [Ceratobasidium sp. 414]